MTAAILTLLGVLASAGFYLLKRRDQKHDDPADENRRRYNQIDADLVKGDAVQNSLHLADDLGELDRLRRAKGDQQ